jgi:hypothetical protein
MKNLKIGSRVYHFLRIGRVGTIVKIESAPMTVMTTEGSLSGLTTVTVRFDDGTEQQFSPENLMRDDR